MAKKIDFEVRKSAFSYPAFEHDICSGLSGICGNSCCYPEFSISASLSGVRQAQVK